MEAEVSDRVRTAYEDVLRVEGHTFSEEIVIDYVQFRRQRHLVIAPHPLRPGVSGCALVLLDTDLIYLRPNLGPLRALDTLMHECAHLLLSHVAPINCTYDELCPVRDEIIKAALCHEPATAYDEIVEDEAETLAMLLVQGVLHYHASVPPTATSLYGH